jgi:hypothetical protein
LRPARANSSQDSISKTHTEKGLVEWLKVKALSSNPSTTKKKQKHNDPNPGNHPTGQKDTKLRVS